MFSDVTCPEILINSVIPLISNELFVVAVICKINKRCSPANNFALQISNTVSYVHKAAMQKTTVNNFSFSLSFPGNM